ncbi:alpha-1-acid glycoprotein 1-like [Pteronotus mesoamericanus]|uniref:alpha-1-acid glycoprotein 1-like n=1 Tax=Pteronotus mesoamericanus TaxID=1884717 RepID=UPI0023EB7A1E|nr:alpha-1-acid glycoprotein 1-like [Pteronotus parnellii mesoamericanus]
MALPWALAVLSLLPLLDAGSPVCTNHTVPITKAALDRISGRWFYIASAYRYPAYKELASKIKTAFFYMTPNHTEDTVLLREYITIGDNCTYKSSNLTINRENGTLVKYENGTGHFGYLMLPKDNRTYMLIAFPDDPQKIAVSFYADKPEVTSEQMDQFYENLWCRGMNKSEVMYTDDKKDLCKTLEKQHEEERKAKGEKTEKDTVLDKDVGDVGGLS